MLADGVKITIGGKELTLILNTEAMAQLADEYGDIEGVGEQLENATYSEKIRILPRLTALLATQGEAVKGSGEVIEPEFIMRYTLPCHIPMLTDAFQRAVAIGMNITVEKSNEDTDVVLEQIQKNAPGAAGN